MDADDVDVVIIGSGAGGGACAWALAQAGVKVMVLEAGPAYNPLTDYDLDKPTWELKGFPRKEKYRAKYSYGEMQPLESRWDHLRSWNHISGKLNRTKKRRSAGYHHVRGVGGSTLHFTGEAHRLHPDAMKMQSRFGVGADWPIDYQELEPYYTQAEKVIGVAGPLANPVRKRSEPYPLKPHNLSYASKKIIHATRDLGFNWEPNPLAVLSEPYDNRPACNYCAGCIRGCPRTDKGSVDVTFMRKALLTGNCSLKTESPVLHINAGKNHKVDSVVYLDSSGKQQQIKTRVLVVACGAVETPRLLLLSANSHAPDGIANETGQVGQNFMETLYWVSSGLHPDRLDAYRGLPSDMICWDYNAPDSNNETVGGFRLMPLAWYGPVYHAQNIVKGWGKPHKALMREQFGRLLTIGSIGESLPNNKSFINIDHDKKDTLDLPIARINTNLDETELMRLTLMAKKARAVLDACGVENITGEFGTYDHFSATHVFGTCRMGSESVDSVVNQDGRAHFWKNVYVADASVFPSSGGGESPSLTIEALAIRTAEKIREAMLARLI